MVKIPFQKIDLKEAVTMNRQYWQAKDLLKVLAKKLPQRIRRDVWIAVDKEMADRPTVDLPQVFQNCAGIDLPWTLKLFAAENTIKHQQVILNDKLRESPLWRLLGEALVEAAENSGKVLILFKLAYMGLFVMHNMTPPSDRTYICVPAQKDGLSNIIIEPLEQWAERNLTNV